MKCVHCGNSQTDGLKVCPECGTRLMARDASAEMAIHAARLLGSAEAVRVASFPKEAEAICREALKLDPQSAAVHVLMARLLEDRGDSEGAAAERQEAAKLNSAAVPPSGKTGAPSLRARLPRSQAVRSVIIGTGAGVVVLALALLLQRFLHPARFVLPASNPQGTSISPGTPLSGFAIPAPASQNPTAQGSNGYSSFSGGTPDLASPAPVTGQETTPAGTVNGRAQAPAYRMPLSSRVGAPPAGPSISEGSNSPSSSPLRSLNSPISPAHPALTASDPAPIEPAAPPGVAFAGSEAQPAVEAHETYQESVTQAQRDYAAGNYGRAIDHYQKALHNDLSQLDSARIRQQMAMAYESMGATREARSQYGLAEQLFGSQLNGPSSDFAKQALETVRKQRESLENAP